MKKVIFLLIVATASFSTSCNYMTEKTADKPLVTTGVAATGPDAVIYKTRADYDSLVPVIMNAEKTEIVSFPGTRDLRYKGEISFPTVLEDGFLLDNRGINENVVFLDMTYMEYMALDKTPAKAELMERILDRDPITVMYNCGKRALYENETEELNALILQGDFSGFEKLK
jgi:signal recognition particle receptor subunit beta